MKIKVRKLNIALLILATIIPSYWFIGGRKILNLLYYITAILFLIQFLLGGGMKNKVKFGLSSAYIFSLVAYSMQAFMDSGMLTALNDLVATSMVVLIAAKSVKDKRDFNQVIDGLLFTAIPLLIIGVIEALTEYNLFQDSGFTLAGASFYSEVRLGILRVSSIFGHPIVYCNYLSIIAALCVYRLSNQISRQKRRNLRLIYALAFVNIVLTVSRSVMLVFVAEQIILFAIKGEHWLTKRKLTLFLFVVAAAFICELLGFGVMDQVEDIINMLLQVFGLGSDSYSSSFSNSGYTGLTGDRWNLYIWVVALLPGHWLFGRGTTAQFSYMATEYREKNAIENYYLSTLFHHGILGLVVLIIGFVSLVIYVGGNWKRNKKLAQKLPGEGKLTFDVTILCILVGELLSYFMVNQAGEVRLFYICIGLLIAYNKLVSFHSNAMMGEVRK